MPTAIERRRACACWREVARLIREDAPNAAVLKELRHQLARILTGLDRQQRLAARSTEHDAGTGITSQQERSRDDVNSLVTAETVVSVKLCAHSKNFPN